MKRRFIILLLAVGVVGVEAGPQSAQAQAEAAAVTAAKVWLALVDAGKYAESWTTAAGFFKGVVKQEQWVEAMTGVRTPLGKNTSREVKSATYMTALPGAPDGKYVVIQFQASFENKRSAVETVTPMLDKDGKWRVSGYFIK